MALPEIDAPMWNLSARLAALRRQIDDLQNRILMRQIEIENRKAQGLSTEADAAVLRTMLDSLQLMSLNRAELERHIAEAGPEPK